MAFAWRSDRAEIPSGTTGRWSIERNVTFDTPVRNVVVTLNGFKLDFSSEDHHINIIEVDIAFNRFGGGNRTVFFQASAQYADKNFDDPYSGYVDTVIIADVQ